MATWQPWISFLSNTQGPWLFLWSPPELFLHQMRNKSMTCEVIKKEGIAHLPPLSFRSHHVSVPPQLCLRRAGLFAAFRLDVLRMWQYCLLERLCLCASFSSRSATGSLKQPGKRCCTAPSNAAYAGAKLLQEATTSSVLHQGQESRSYVKPKRTLPTLISPGDRTVS